MKVWAKVFGMATSALMAVLIALPATVLAAGPADADCGDPGQPACTGPVPTTDQVNAALTKMTDPNIPQDKADVVTPAFSPDECQKIDYHLNRLNAGGLIPFNFVVTDVQQAPNDLAGATVSVTRPWVRPGPIVLVNQGGHWKITHDTALTGLRAIVANTNYVPFNGGLAGSSI